MKKMGLRPAEWRFTLLGVLAFISLVGISLGISRLIHPLWGMLFVAYVIITFCFSRSVIRRTLLLPLVLVALHTLLITVVAVIDDLSAWDDMSPTMLVMFAVYVLDYPIHYVFRIIELFPSEVGRWYAVQLVATGGLLWFGVGLFMKTTLSSLARLFPSRE